MPKIRKLARNCAERKMEKILDRLAELILSEMNKRNCSARCFAELCGVNRNTLGGVINRKENDVKLSFIWNICENTEIRLSDIFEIECSEEFNIENYILTNGKEKYVIKKLGRGERTSAF